MKAFLSPEATRPWPNFKLFKTSAHFHKKEKGINIVLNFFLKQGFHATNSDLLISLSLQPRTELT